MSRNAWLFAAASALALTSVTGTAASQSKVDVLAASLAADRDNCAKMAKDAQSNHGLAIYQSSLDAQLDALRAKNDAQLYAMSHGSRESTEFLENRLDADQAARADTDKAIEAKYKADGQKVAQCVADAVQQGKDDYVAFRAHARKADRGEGESLMTAWLANVREISTNSPEGSSASEAAWKAAKAHAEVASM
jgi:hypothetical protein